MREIDSWVLGYLVNAAWQAVVVFAGAWVLTRGLRRLGPQVEHCIWVTALLLQVVLPAVHVDPFLFLWSHLRSGAPGLVTVTTGAGVTQGGLAASAWVVKGLLALYGCAMAFTGARLAVGLWRTRRLVQESAPIELPYEAARMWAQVCTHGGVMAEVRVSGAVRGPATVGVRRKLLLLPPGFVEGSSAVEFCAAVAHERAHMRRNDFAKNFFYEVLRLPVAWHPAVWLTRARLTESREMVCDALAAEAAGGDREYAGALVRLAARFVSLPGRQSHAIGIFDANRFEERVMRLIEMKQQVKGVRRAVLLAVCVALGVGTCALAAELRVSVAVPAALQQAGAPATVPAGVMAGQLESRVNPIYPPIAKAAKVSGAVVVRAVIAKDGTMKSLHVLSGPDMLKGCTLEALRQWKYKPYLLNGEPTEVDTTITVTYNLPVEKPAAAEPQ